MYVVQPDFRCQIPVFLWEIVAKTIRQGIMTLLRKEKINFILLHILREI